MAERERRTSDFSDLAREFAERGCVAQRLHGQVFDFLVPDGQILTAALAGVRFSADVMPNGHCAMIFLGNFSEFLSRRMAINLSINEKGVVFHSDIFNVKCPDVDTFCIMSPCDETAEGISYERAYQSINYVKSVISLSMGPNPVFRRVGEFDLHGDGKFSFPSDVIALPLIPGFYINDDEHLTLNVVKAISRQDANLKEKFLTASKFMSRALSESDPVVKFVNYWTSIEVIAGKSQSARDLLSKIYGISIKRVDEFLRFKIYSDRRHALFHHGKEPQLDARDERLLGLYFWDLVIHKIGMKCQRLSEKFSQSNVWG